MIAKDRLSGRKTLAVDGILEDLEKDRLKSSINLVELFGSFGVSLDKKGSSFMGCCPFHEDKTPSLSVDPGKGLWHCFGCGESGDAFTLVEKLQGLDFKGALAYFKTPISSRPQVKRIEPIIEKKSFILDEIVVFYSKNLGEGEEAKKYLEGRGLWNPEILKRHKVGFSAGTLASIVGDEQRAELVSLGVIKESGKEHFTRCIVVPLFDETDHVAGFYGRRIDKNATPAHLYLPGPHCGLVNRAAARAYRDRLILTEAVLDAFALEALGFLNVIPCYGANGFSAEHEKLIRDERVQEVILAFDADEAGRKGAQGVIKKLATQSIRTKAIEPPKGKDWNEFLLSGGTKDIVESAILSSTITPEVETSGVLTSSKSDTLAMNKESGRHIFSRHDGSHGGVRYRVTGARESFQASLRVGVRAEVASEGEAARTYVDTVDLYSARSRLSFSSACAQTGIESSRVERDLLSMLDLLEAERDERLRSLVEGPRVLTNDEKELGLELLRAPDLCETIMRDLTTLGYVGEDLNKLLVYLAATSRKLNDPISVIVSSQSASGKSFLIDSVKALMPEEDVVSMTSLSDQALNYLPDDALIHKFLVMGEAVHAESVEHQLREMLSAKELSRLVTMKDEKTGELSSRLVRKKAIVAVAMSTTSSDVNPENASRSFVVSTDESEAQTKAVHERQRSKYSLERFASAQDEVPAIIARHHAAQRLLERIAIVNPYASLLDFPARLMRTRRDHERFLDLIAVVCFLRQFQKERKQDESGRDYIECDLSDYERAYAIMRSILPSTLSSFPRSSRELYEDVRRLAAAKAERESIPVVEATLTQREIRDATGASQFMVKEALRLLVEYEYLACAGFRTRGSRLSYRLIVDEPLRLVDLTSIPTPSDLERTLARALNSLGGT